MPTCSWKKHCTTEFKRIVLYLSFFFSGFELKKSYSLPRLHSDKQICKKSRCAWALQEKHCSHVSRKCKAKLCLAFPMKIHHSSFCFPPYKTRTTLQNLKAKKEIRSFRHTKLCHGSFETDAHYRTGTSIGISPSTALLN